MDRLSILFVDDEPNLLVGLRRMLHGMRQEWDMGFAENGSKALEMLTAQKYDVVVSDMRMPGMNGSDLLNEVMKRHPETVRIILSGHSDEELILKSVGSAHQFLAKPCSPEKLKATILEAHSAHRLPMDDELRSVVSQMESLPTLPALYLEIVEELKSPDPSIRKIGDVVAKDIGMTGKILQLVNSAFFGLPREVSSLQQAASLLGIETIKTLVLSLKVFSQFEQRNLSCLNIDALWRHSLKTAQCAKLISRSEKAPTKITDEAFMAGVLHDVGKLILAVNLSEEYASALSTAESRKVPVFTVEKEELGASHAEVGGYLLGLWGLPPGIAEAVALHHSPRSHAGEEFCAITAVHAANGIAHETQDDAETCRERIDFEYLEELDLSQRLLTWRESCCEVVGEGSAK